jgi:hypothetical protein
MAEARCGLLWCNPVALNDGFLAQQLTRLATELLLRHGFEPMISITVLMDRTLSCSYRSVTIAKCPVTTSVPWPATGNGSVNSPERGITRTG